MELKSRIQLTNSCRSCFVGRGSHRGTAGTAAVGLGTRPRTAGTAARKLPCSELLGKRYQAVVVELHRRHRRSAKFN